MKHKSSSKAVMSLPVTQVKYEEDRGAEHHEPDLPPVHWETIPLTLVLKDLSLKRGHNWYENVERGTAENKN